MLVCGRVIRFNARFGRLYFVILLKNVNYKSLVVAEYNRLKECFLYKY